MTQPVDEPRETPEGSARRFATVRSGETWLNKHHDSSDALWLLLSRPGAWPAAKNSIRDGDGWRNICFIVGDGSITVGNTSTYSSYLP